MRAFSTPSTVATISTVVTLLVLASPALAFRCGTHLIREGDHYLQVLRHCGQPSIEERFLQERMVSRQIHRLIPSRAYTSEGLIIHLWTYNFGAQKFMRQLRFEDGILVRIEKVDYGY